MLLKETINLKYKYLLNKRSQNFFFAAAAGAVNPLSVC